jgi:hypothetical protein
MSFDEKKRDKNIELIVVLFILLINVGASFMRGAY